MTKINAVLLISLYFSTVLCSSHRIKDKGDILVLSNGAARWTFPTNCTNDCRHVEWIQIQRDDEMFMQFTITGSSNMQYLAIALSADDVMGNDDAYICSKTTSFSNQIQIRSAYLTGFAPPIIVSTLSNKTGSSSNIADEFMTCTFLRPFNVTKEVSGLNMTWQIASRNYFILFAEGNVDSKGSIEYHRNRMSTSRAFNLVANDFHKTLTNTGNLLNLNLSVAVNSADQIIKSVNGGSWQVPNNQCPQGHCKSIRWEVVMKPKGPMIQFTIIGNSGGWIGMAISDDDALGDDECYYCVNDSPKSRFPLISTGVLNENGKPTNIKRIKPKKISIASIDSNVMVCGFFRPINVTKTVNNTLLTWDLSQRRFNLFYAEGSPANNPISFQSSLRRTHDPFYLLSNEGYKPNRQDHDIDPLENSTLFPITEFPPDSEFEEQPTGGGRWVFPPGCGNSSCRSLIWEPIIRNGVETLKYTITGFGKDYVGFRFPTKRSINFQECVVCIRNQSRQTQIDVKYGLCVPNTSPTTFQKISSDEIIRTESTENSLSCSFYRQLKRRSMGNENILHRSANEFILTYEEGSSSINQGRSLNSTFKSFISVPVTWINWNRFQKSLNTNEKIKPAPMMTVQTQCVGSNCGKSPNLRASTFYRLILAFLVFFVLHFMSIPTA